jgi:hypothetical protein
MLTERCPFLGALVADAVAMPVHWYYDQGALDRDYPQLAEVVSASRTKTPTSWRLLTRSYESSWPPGRRRSRRRWASDW